MIKKEKTISEKWRRIKKGEIMKRGNNLKSRKSVRKRKSSK